jgi:hypothetical protein
MVSQPHLPPNRFCYSDPRDELASDLPHSLVSRGLFEGSRRDTVVDFAYVLDWSRPFRTRVWYLEYGQYVMQYVNDVEVLRRMAHGVSA